MNIILIGFMATGKSTIGRALARQLDLPLLDMDRELEKRIGMPIPDYFAASGEAQFRGQEIGLLQSLVDEMALSATATRQFPRRFVLSTGGGVPLSEENRELLRKIGHVVWLRANLSTIVERCRPRIERRPMLAGHEDDLEEHIGALLKARIPAYEACADTTAWTDDRVSPDQIALRIKRAISRAK